MKLGRLFRRRKKERRELTVENAERRAAYAHEHSVTDPVLRSVAAERVRTVLDRAAEIGNITGVVTIRTKPKTANQ